VSQTGSSKARYIVGPLIVVAAAIGGYFAYEAFRPEPSISPAPAAAPTPEAESDSGPESGALKAKAVPERLPEFTLANLDGKPTPISTYAGRPLMVNFWATWCAPCRREIPLLNKIRAQRKSQNAEIVGVAVDFRDAVVAFTKKVPIDYPQLIGEEDGLAAAEAFGMGMAFPFSVFIDSEGRILTIKIGELHEDEANFAFDRLRDLDNKVLTIEEAQAHVAEAFKEMAAARAQEDASHAPKTRETAGK
jgi:thiol-disulfide isomerase/thioredoxin